MRKASPVGTTVFRLMATLALSSLIGCTSAARLFDLRDERLPDARGVHIPIDQVPKAVIDEYHRHCSDAVRSAESCDEGAQFRLESDRGSILHIGKHGQFLGEII